MKQKIIQLVVIAIIKKDNRFLLTLRNEPNNKKFHKMWQLPGGAVEFGEHPEEAVKREMEEELGVRIISVKLIPYIFYRTDENWHRIFINYLCEIEHGEIILNEEALEFQWFEKEQINKLNTIGPVYNLIKKI